MIETRHEFLLPVAPAQAFDLFARPENDPLWQAACESARSDPQASDRYRVVFSFLGRRMAFTCEVSERQRPRIHAFRTVEGPFAYRGSYRFEPHAQGTRVHWHFAADPGGFFGLLPDTLLRKVLLSQFESDVLTLQRHLCAPAAV